jgi:hypothetical protein
MKMRRFAAGILAAAVCAPVIAGELKSGPQVGEKMPGPFHAYNVNGPWKGEKQCIYCVAGDSPTVMIFARESTPALTKLIRKVDEATTKNTKADMKSFAVFLNDKKGLDKELEALVEKEKIKDTILAVDSPEGPKKYDVAKDAEVTVLIYVDYKIKANHTFKKGEFTEADIEKICADLPKILTN